MSASDSLVVRAAGLGSHLLSRETLARLASLPDLPTLGRELANLGFVLPGHAPAAGDLELAIRRNAAGRLHQLARWDETGGIALLLLAEQERRSIRSLLRGLVAGLAPTLRMSGLLPTPGLPERALEELSRQQELAGMVAFLTTWRSPWAEALAGVRGSEPDLIEAELALGRVLARQLQAGARRLGGDFRDYARESLDLENLRTALLLAGRTDELKAATHFLECGAQVDAAHFRAAATAETPLLAAELLAPVLEEPELASRLVTLAADPVALERALAEWRLGAWKRRARMDPLGAAPVIAYALRLEGEVRSLQRIIWAITLQAPVALRLAAEVPA